MCVCVFVNPSEENGATCTLHTHRHTRVIVEERLQTVAAGLRLKPSAAGDGVRQGIKSGRVLCRRGEPAVCCAPMWTWSLSLQIQRITDRRPKATAEYCQTRQTKKKASKWTQIIVTANCFFFCMLLVNALKLIRILHIENIYFVFPPF